MRPQNYKKVEIIATFLPWFFCVIATFSDIKQKKHRDNPMFLSWWWALTDSNRRPSACKADALNQLS